MRRHSFFVLAALAVLALALGSCGEEQLRTVAQSKKFVRDIAKGGKADDWKLGGGATVVAKDAWGHQGTLEELGAKLRDHGVEWSCETAKQVHRAHKVIAGLGLDVSDADREAIIDTARSNGAQPDEANAVIENALHLTGSELVEATAAVCELGEQL